MNFFLIIKNNINKEYKVYYYNKIKLLIKIVYLLIVLTIFFYILVNDSQNYVFKNEIKFYKKYIISCSRLKKYKNKESIINKYPYLSIILPVYNIEKHFIARVLLSVLNQSFQDFEIIIVNDYSTNNIKQMIDDYKLKEDNIKIIHHNQNLGTYISRVDGVLNANGKYILFIDPDDILLNPFLFYKIFEINNKYHLDIIEFVVFLEEEANHNIYISDDHGLSHYHKFEQKIIYQPQLSNLLFFEPRNKIILLYFVELYGIKLLKKVFY